MASLASVATPPRFRRTSTLLREICHELWRTPVGAAEPTSIDGDLYGAAEPTSIDGEQGTIYLEVNRRGSPHTHLAAERFLQAREVSSAEAVFRVFGTQREAPAPQA